MTLELEHHAEEKYLEVTVSGKLHKEDYLKFVPSVEALIAEHDKIRILMMLSDFHGWDAGALWEDVKFDFKHFNHIERLAIVGETRWQHGMAVFCRPFTTAKIQYFDKLKATEARKWIAA